MALFFKIWATLGILFGLVALSDAAPLKIRIGRGGAGEEQLWLMAAKPEIATNQGKSYVLEMINFPATDKRFLAFEAGELDIATGGSSGVLMFASSGAKVTAVASLSKESNKGFVAEYMVNANSAIKTVKDLKGKTIGINGFNSSTQLWAIMALQRAGIDPKDVTFVTLPFSAHGEALRAGKIDLGAFPQPFAKLEQVRGGSRTLFTSREGAPFDEELILLVARPEFLKNNAEGVKAFLSDLVASTKYYEQNPKVARQALIDAKFVRLPPSVYYEMTDYYREPGARIDTAALQETQNLQLKMGWQKTPVDINTLVDLSYLPK